MGTPANPPAGEGLLYFKSDNKLYQKIGSTETQVGGGVVDPRLGPYSQDISGVSLDILTGNGWFRGNNLVNSPDGTNGWFFIESEIHDGFGQWQHQRASGYGGAQGPVGTWERLRTNGVWGPWRMMLDSGSVGFASDSWQLSSSANTQLTTTAQVILPGLTQVVTATSTSDVFMVSCAADALSLSASPTLVIRPYVDAVAPFVNRDLNFQGPVNTRAGISQKWRITGLTPGQHTIDMRAQITAAGSFTVHTHSTMTIERFSAGLLSNVPLTAGILSGGWAIADSTLDVPSFEKISGVLYLSGVAKSGAVGIANPIFTLPVGCRPLKTKILNSMSWTGNADLRVAPDGRVYVFAYGSGGNNGSVSLDGLSFVPKQ
jgi:hypothetical protein